MINRAVIFVLAGMCFLLRLVRCGSTSVFIADYGQCVCKPYNKVCLKEVVEINIYSRSSSRTITCWYGTRLCCDLTSPKEPQPRREFIRGFVAQMPLARGGFRARHETLDHLGGKNLAKSHEPSGFGESIRKGIQKIFSNWGPRNHTASDTGNQGDSAREIAHELKIIDNKKDYRGENESKVIIDKPDELAFHSSTICSGLNIECRNPNVQNTENGVLTDVIGLGDKVTSTANTKGLNFRSSTYSTVVIPHIDAFRISGVSHSFSNTDVTNLTGPFDLVSNSEMHTNEPKTFHKFISITAKQNSILSVEKKNFDRKSVSSPDTISPNAQILEIGSFTLASSKFTNMKLSEDIRFQSSLTSLSFYSTATLPLLKEFYAGNILTGSIQNTPFKYRLLEQVDVVEVSTPAFHSQFVMTEFGENFYGRNDSSSASTQYKSLSLQTSCSTRILAISLQEAVRENPMATMQSMVGLTLNQECLEPYSSVHSATPPLERITYMVESMQHSNFTIDRPFLSKHPWNFSQSTTVQIFSASTRSPLGLSNTLVTYVSGMQSYLVQSITPYVLTKLAMQTIASTNIPISNETNTNLSAHSSLYISTESIYIQNSTTLGISTIEPTFWYSQDTVPLITSSLNHNLTDNMQEEMSTPILMEEIQSLNTKTNTHMWGSLPVHRINNNISSWKNSFMYSSPFVSSYLYMNTYTVHSLGNSDPLASAIADSHGNLKQFSIIAPVSMKLKVSPSETKKFHSYLHTSHLLDFLSYRKSETLAKGPITDRLGFPTLKPLLKVNSTKTLFTEASTPNSTLITLNNVIVGDKAPMLSQMYGFNRNTEFKNSKFLEHNHLRSKIVHTHSIRHSPLYTTKTINPNTPRSSHNSNIRFSHVPLPILYIKPSHSSQEEFRAYLQSLREETFNKTKKLDNEENGFWQWLFG